MLARQPWSPDLLTETPLRHQSGQADDLTMTRHGPLTAGT